MLEAVTKDQLNTGLSGQIRFKISERNLYAYIFGVKNPIAHVMGYFVSVLRERIANFEAPNAADGTPAIQTGISINDLRKNLRDINEHMDKECGSSAARYGVQLDASLITSIDPPPEVESALAAINTAHNQVSSDISLAQASADQKIVQSRRAVEIETLKAQAEVEPLRLMASQLAELKANGAKPRAGRLRAECGARILRPGWPPGEAGGEVMLTIVVTFVAASSPASSECPSYSAYPACSASTPSSRAPLQGLRASEKVIAVLDEPGLLHYILWIVGWRALFINWVGRCYDIDLRLDQEYLRSQPVNSKKARPWASHLV